MNDENTFRILLSTDNHLGFLEKDEIRGNDSFITFEEILSIGENLKPDLVLLGGDLFHENKPSLSSLFKCTELLRKYSNNSCPINFKIVSDQSSNFDHSKYFKFANINDENLNVGMPLFSIHGNHDDPIDKSNLCALDLLHASGLVNLFGKNDSVERVEIRPILLCKGSTRVALYGLGAIRNERLNRMWAQNKVVFVRPNEEPDTWFNIFVVHQNRVRHGPSNFLPENMLPSFLDLVIWGHEHDCRLDPEWSTGPELYISQPGSSVATSLSDGEAIDKYIGLLRVIGREFLIEKIKLETVRPFITEMVVLQDEPKLNVDDPRVDRQLEVFFHEKIESMLTAVESKRSQHQNQPKLPLLRLKVDYSGGFELFSTTRLCQKYVDRVANLGDMVVLNRKKEYSAREKIENNFVFVGAKELGPDAATVEDIVRQYFHKASEKLKMTMLNERELGVGVKLFVEKDNNEMVSRVVEIQIDRILESMKKRSFTEMSIDKEIGRIVGLMKTMSAKDGDVDEEEMMQRLLKEVPDVSTTIVVVSDDEDEEMFEAPKTTRGRGRGRGRGSSRCVVDDNLTLDDDLGSSLGKRKDSTVKKEPAKKKKT